MQTLVVDFETYFDKDVSLKKLPTILYVRHPKFKVHGAAIKEGTNPARWISGKDLPAYFANVNWDDVECISHNALFDMLILAEKYGIRPKRYIDTLGLARALLPADMDFDLDTLGPCLGLPGKTGGGKVLQKCKGLEELPPELEAELGVYACNDGETTYGFYSLLWHHLPETERELLDLIIQMGVQGRLRFNHATATEALTEANEKRNAKLEASGLDITVLRSGPKFADALRAKGVEPPMKISDKTGKPTYAFSKQDRKFLDLLDHPNVAHLCAARLAAMSNGEVNRIERLLAITSLQPYTIPMPLAYCAAHTLRLGGTGGINVQNLKKGPGGKPGKLRESFEAPDGFVVNVADSAQIELRLALWFCGQFEQLEMLRRGMDLYKHFAAKLFNVPVDEVTKPQRQLAKVVILGSQYGIGFRKFRALCAIGPMGNPPIFLSEEEAQNIINVYRASHPFIKAMWDWLSNQAIPAMSQPTCNIVRGPITFKHERIELPNGLALLYPNLRFEVDEETGDSGWVYGINGVKHRIYGGLLLENIIQALARIVVTDQLVRCAKEIEHFWPVSMTHDENIGISPEQHAEDVQRRMIEIMSVSPAWAPDLPMAAEGGYAKTYSK